MKILFNKNRKGTALIVALLVMGVLMAISLALSALVLRETVITKDFLDAGRSYYAAESATEIGLYGVKNNLPGWQPKVDKNGYTAIKIDDEYDSVAQLKVHNKCKAYPCFDEGFKVESAEPKAFYASLGLNESATIPLFVIGEDGKASEITDFTVEFYANFGAEDVKIKGNLSGWDVLRWKIVGLNKDDAMPITESISDFTAVSLLNTGDSSNAANPSWFGTIACDQGVGRYTNSIKCAAYSTPSADNCSQLQARQFYKYEGSGEDRKIDPINHCYPIERFIVDHRMNYLTLTNLINPEVFRSGSQKVDAKTKVFYRVELFTEDGQKTADTVRQYADITTDGYSGKSKQSINVKIKRDSFMPVFNFSLYSTYMDEAAGRGEEFWYGKEEKQGL